MEPDPYGIDARYYDLIHEDHDHDDDVGLWLSFAGRTDRPVLEVGCGTGRIAVALAAAGHAVTGLDPSRAMLDLARERAGREGVALELVHGRGGDAPLPAETFGFVLVPADVFLYCANGEEQIATLHALARAMQFNAHLAIDLPGPQLALDATTNGQPVLAWSGGDPEGGVLDVWHVHEDDLGAQTRWLRVTYDRTGPDGVVRRASSDHILRYPYRFEVEYLLALAGLTVTGVYGDYELGPLTNASDRMIVIAMRTEG